MQSPKLVTAPSGDVVTLTDAKLFLRVDGTDEDTVIQAFIDAAVVMVELFTNRKLLSQTWDCFYDNIPSRFRDDLMQDGWQQGKLSEFIEVKKYLELPFMPMSAVTFIKTFDDQNTEYVMPTTDYFADTNSEPGRVSLTNSSTWPTTYLRPVDGMVVRAVFGYGAAAQVPAPIKQAIKLLVAMYYEKRGCDDAEIPAACASILSQYRVRRFA